MAPGLSGQTSILGVVFFVSKSLLETKRQNKPKKFAILIRKGWSHASCKCCLLTSRELGDPSRRLPKRKKKKESLSQDRV